MKFSPILIVAGEPNSIFIEIFIKSLKRIKIKRPIILISSLKVIKLQMIKLNYNIEINILDYKKLNNYKLNNRSINLINVEFNQKKAFLKISKNSKKYIEKTFRIAFKIIKKEKIKRFINGPISKKHFLDKKYLGITEYISDYFSQKKTCMLIFNKKLSVCPITTHLPLKLVPKNINKKKIEDKIYLIQNFYNKYFKIKPKIGVLGVNPHCESILQYNEDEKIIKPLIRNMKKKVLN